jgi:hypothetical protein
MRGTRVIVSPIEPDDTDDADDADDQDNNTPTGGEETP